MNIVDLAQALVEVLTDQNTLAQIVLLIVVGMYSIFALVVAVQIRILNNVVTQATFAPVFKMLAYIHAGLALMLFAVTTLLLF